MKTAYSHNDRGTGGGQIKAFRSALFSGLVVCFRSALQHFCVRVWREWLCLGRALFWDVLWGLGTGQVELGMLGVFWRFWFSGGGGRVAMKVSVIGVRGVPNVMGGIEAHCEHLYPRIVSSDPGFEVTILARSPYAGREAYDYEGLRVRPVWTVRNVTFETILHSFLAVLQSGLVQRDAVLHIHAIGPCLLAPLARALGLRVVATHHGYDYEREKWGFVARTALRLGEVLMLRAAQQIICVSGETTEALRRRAPWRAGSIHTIPNGAAVSAASLSEGGSDPLAGLGLKPGCYVLAVGRLVPEKGFHDLVSAFERVGGERKLVIVGGAHHASAYSDALLARASDRVIFAGVRGRAELGALYRSAGLFVLPSSLEGHPIVALEALAAGAPILLSDIATNREIGLPAANYFPVGDVAALAAALDRPDHEALRNRDPGILAAYDWDLVAARTAEVLRLAAAP